MCMQMDGLGLLAGREERVPVVVLVVDRRQAERVRVLGERHRVAALVGAAPHLGGRQLGVPQRDHRERDEAALAVTGAPLVDHPVVVGLDAEQRQLLVVALQERLAAEAGQRVREADGRRRCGWRPCRPGAPSGSSSPAGSRRRWWADVELGEADGGRQLGERVDEVVVEPPVAPGSPSVDALLEGEHARRRSGRPSARARPGAPGPGTWPGAGRSTGPAARRRGRRPR